MLELSNVEMSLAGAPVVADVSLSIASGEFAVLIGPSGCGKTTLLRIAAGALRPMSGRVVRGFARSAFVFQEPRLAPWASALDNAAFGLKALGVPARRRRLEAERILMRFGFEPGDLGKRSPALSGGMRQRVAVARALAIRPQLLLMDEPFASLDVGLRRRLQDLVRGEADSSGIAVLFVTHDVAEAVRLASRVLVLSPRPCRIVADHPNTPLCDPALIYEAAAALLQREEIAAVLFPPGLDGLQRDRHDAAPPSFAHPDPTLERRP